MARRKRRKTRRVKLPPGTCKNVRRPGGGSVLLCNPKGRGGPKFMKRSRARAAGYRMRGGGRV